MDIFDSVNFTAPTELKGERFYLTKKGGSLKLVVRSPLFEKFFREQSKGEIYGLSSPLWGHSQYRFTIDPGIQAELRRMGVSFGEMKTFWGRGAHDRLPMPGDAPHIFNVGFLSCVGIGEGLSFPIRDMIPLSLLEGPDYIMSNTLKRGLYYMIRQFILDFECSIHIVTQNKTGEI